VPTSTGRRGEIFIEKRKENIRVTRRSLSLSLSLTTLNGENMKFSLILSTPSKGHHQGVYIDT